MSVNRLCNILCIVRLVEIFDILLDYLNIFYVIFSASEYLFPQPASRNDNAKRHKNGTKIVFFMFVFPFKIRFRLAVLSLLQFKNPHLTEIILRING